MTKPLALTIAIIGRPNVGKSTLFNRLTGSNHALVNPIPGLTRDRRYGEATIGGLSFTVIDTAGLEQEDGQGLEQHMMQQTRAAIEEADALFFVYDGRDGITMQDEHFVGMIRAANKPVLLVANKCENAAKAEAGLQEGYALGFGEPMALSAEHGIGTVYLADSILKWVEEGTLTLPEEEDEQEKPELQLALVGRPNAGKSTLFNTLLKEERAIVSDVAGTTRDAVYESILWDGEVVKLVDTAGLRKRSRRKDTPEQLSVSDTMHAIQYAHVVVLLVDSVLGMDKQDFSIAERVLEEGRALIVAFNKWDIAEEKQAFMEEMRYRMEKSLSQAKDIPLLTISALNKKGIKVLMKEVFALFELWNTRIGTGPLNSWLHQATERHIPPLSGGRRIRLRYITQAKTRPPTFVLFTSSNVNELPKSYLRYLTNDIREHFGLSGTPIRLHLRKNHNPYGEK